MIKNRWLLYGLLSMFVAFAPFEGSAASKDIKSSSSTSSGSGGFKAASSSWDRPKPATPEIIRPKVVAPAPTVSAPSIPGGASAPKVAAPVPPAVGVNSPKPPASVAPVPPSGASTSGVKAPMPPGSVSSAPTVSAPSIPGGASAPKVAAPVPPAVGVNSPKPPASVAPVPPSGASTSGVKAPKVPVPGTVSLANLPQTKADRAQARSASLKADNERKAQAQAKVNEARKSEDFQKATGGRTFEKRVIVVERTRFYERYNDPIYVERRAPFVGHSYGGMEGGTLSTLLVANTVVNSMMWYSLMNDHRHAMFLADARREAQMRNDRVILDRLDYIEAENARLRNQGVQPQSVAQVLQENKIPVEAAFTPEVLTGQVEIPELGVATGMTGGIYSALCGGKSDGSFKGLKTVAKTYGVSVSCQNTGGGDDNVRLAMQGGVGAFMVQADNLLYWQQNRGIDFGGNEWVLYQEPMLFLTSKDSKIEGIKDINKDTTVYVVGGSSLSWDVLKSFAANDKFLGMGGNKNYAEASVKDVDSIDLAVNAIKKNKNSVLFLVMSVDADIIKRVDRQYGDDVHLIPVNDNRFLSVVDPNEARVYASCEIPGKSLPKLQAGKLWGSNATSTLCTDALFVVDPKWMQELDANSQNLVGMAVMDMFDEMPSLVHRLNK